ncbi:MAG: single-stranded-DNA-specific exonuclease RecJ [Candidatus Fermentibacteraceae bacterium]
MKYKWVPRSVADAAFDGIDGVPASVASVLARRGFTAPEAMAFMDSRWNSLSPWRNLPGAEEAAAAVADAVRIGEGILVHGDFDADGITAVATSVRVLRALGARVDWHIPCRFNEGYGIGETGVRKAIEEGFGLFLTVDCGISAVDPVRILSEAGVRTVITDHHLPGPEVPGACATVDPELSNDPGAPWRRLSGAGVALAVLRGVAELLGNPEIPELEPDLCAIGTACDVVDLVGDNRLILRRGMDVLRSKPSPGILALLRKAGLSSDRIRTRDLSFVIGPRLNSAGRVSHADLAVKLLLTLDPGEARILADELEGCNDRRRELDSGVFAEARKMAGEGPCVVLGSDSWHPGVLGIAASRLVDELSVPVVLISFNGAEGRGSARSVDGVPIHGLLQEALEEGLLVRCGGHSVAAGLSVLRDKFDAFRNFMMERTGAAGEGEVIKPLLHIDGRLLGTECTMQTMRGIKLLEPFGPGNPEPVWIARNAFLLTRELVGRGKHLKMTFQLDGVTGNAIGFNMAKRSADFDRPVDLAFLLREDSFRGSESVQMELLDARPAAGPGS